MFCLCFSPSLVFLFFLYVSHVVLIFSCLFLYFKYFSFNVFVLNFCTCFCLFISSLFFFSKIVCFVFLTV
ncbi:unnamed protein product [Meloidogyne enterolobii]|uniref:Uncharacterized protein n=1 Tax=Meloidogyne enterolobii TaxID=390850 RepID=A0ACB0ZTR3_MELEN